MKAAPAPIKPCAADVEEHNITHTPYRSWCDSCVEGRGLGEQRWRHVGGAHEIPRVGADYWNIITGNLEMREWLVDEYPLTDEGDAALQTARSERKVMKCLIARCHESKAVLAHATPVNGDDEAHYVADLVASDVRSWDTSSLPSRPTTGQLCASWHQYLLEGSAARSGRRTP